MCCEPHETERSHGAMSINLCCCEPGSATFFRRFVSRQEKLDWLEGYMNQLKKELAGVEERLKELKKQ